MAKEGAPKINFEGITLFRRDFSVFKLSLIKSKNKDLWIQKDTLEKERQYLK
jgi:hypothetical protein